MIKNLSMIYPEESFYSYISRLYCHSGYIWNASITRDVLKRPSEFPDYNFINILNDEFKKLLLSRYCFKELVLEHTLLKYYIRLLPKEDREKLYNSMIMNNERIIKFLPIAVNKGNYKLRYCPKCVEEDRLRFGECYFHIKHMIPEIHICAKHKCELKDTNIDNGKIKESPFVPLELVVNDLSVNNYKDVDINYIVAKYITDIFDEPLRLESDFNVGDFLTLFLGDKYVSSRGEQRNLSLIEKDMKNYYCGLKNYSITKARLSFIFRNFSRNVYDLYLVALFSKIPVEQFGVIIKDVRPRYEFFDEKVKMLNKEGYSNAQIAKMLKANHEIIRQVLIGKYDQVKKTKIYSCSKKWDWKSIDEECCKKLKTKLNDSTSDKIITKNKVAKMLGLKDKSLRNLPKLRNLIKEYKDKY